MNGIHDSGGCKIMKLGLGFYTNFQIWTLSSITPLFYVALLGIAQAASHLKLKSIEDYWYGHWIPVSRTAIKTDNRHEDLYVSWALLLVPVPPYIGHSTTSLSNDRCNQKSGW